MKHPQKSLVFALVLSCLAPAGLLPASAQDFPKAAVKLIVPFPPGGPTDTVGRLIGIKLQEAWNQPVLLDYKPGAGTAIGADFVAKSNPDGYTIGMVNSSFPVNPSLRKSLPYDTTKDLSGVTHIANLQLALVARPDAPFNTLPELIAYAKKNPGKLTYGTPGVGGSTHLGMELMQRDAGFEVLHAPMKGSAQAHTELMGGRIDLVVDPFLSILPYVKSGRMKMIATMGPQRVTGHPNFPTVAEVIPGFNVSALVGFVIPSGTPRPIVQKIQTDTALVLANPEVKKRIEDLGMEVIASRPEQFDDFIQSEIRKWKRVITDAKIELE
ncbi:MAG: tripartite tricarboxylate transporter substrate binding protein [Betaproteobacteria bacterium]|nr:tripartite tricarboxylate transporter substrate binding protein [Betaproteobacteria bacterium]